MIPRDALVSYKYYFAGTVPCPKDLYIRTLDAASLPVELQRTLLDAASQHTRNRRSLKQGGSSPKGNSRRKNNQWDEKSEQRTWRASKSPQARWGNDSGRSALSHAWKDKSPEKEVSRTAFSLLNKLCKDNFHSVAKKFQELRIVTKEMLSEIVDMIFNKACLEHTYAETYADLCLLLQQSYPTFPGANPEQRESFASILLNRCQHEFACIPSTLCPETFRNRASFVSMMTTTTSEANDVDIYLIKTKKRISGLMKVIAHLYLRDLFGNKVIREVALHLIFRKQTPEEHYVECFCVLVKNIGATLDSSANGRDYVTTFLSRLEEILSTGQYSSRIRFFVLDLTELRTNKWIDKRGQVQVQTKEAIKEARNKPEGATPFVQQVAGARPAYIKEQMQKVASIRVFDFNKVITVSEYFADDKQADAAVKDWLSLDLDRKGYVQAVMVLLERGYDRHDKADMLVEYIQALKEYITPDILKEALDSVKPNLKDAAIDNPKAYEFQAHILEHLNEILIESEFHEVKKRKSKTGTPGSFLPFKAGSPKGFTMRQAVFNEEAQEQVHDGFERRRSMKLKQPLKSCLRNNPK